MSIERREEALLLDVRRPRIKVLLGDIELHGATAAEIETSGHFAVNKFRVKFSSIVETGLLHIPGSQIEIKIELADVWHSQIVGLIDNVSYDTALRTFCVEGRDLSSQLVEAQTCESFANRTASEIATVIGTRHGLIVSADPTFAAVGRFYQSEHDQITLSQFGKVLSEWDLLATLAVREGFELYVSGRTLRFGLPAMTAARSIHSSDCISMYLDHAIGLARPIDVLVQSWNSKTGNTAVGRAFTYGLGPVWERRSTRPNLTTDSAQQQAEGILADLKRHEWNVSITLPGSCDLNSRNVVLLQGTASPWDRLYQVVHETKRIDVRRGFIQTLRLQGIV